MPIDFNKMEPDKQPDVQTAALVSIALNLTKIANILARWDHRGALLVQKRG
jgi:hypothetical protein